MSPAEGISAILEAAGLCGGVTGWASYVGQLGALDQAVCCFDHAGRGGEVKVAIDYPAVQIIVRGTKAQGGYSDAYAKAQEVFAALQGIDQNPTAYTNLVSCVARGQPTGMGRDENDRPMISLNFNLITNPDDDGYRTY